MERLLKRVGDLDVIDMPADTGAGLRKIASGVVLIAKSDANLLACEAGKVDLSERESCLALTSGTDLGERVVRPAIPAIDGDLNLGDLGVCGPTQLAHEKEFRVVSDR